ncbi:MAG TPA: tetratricopeptide repeat protein [Pseudolabrys sp.]|nr:tetratricopeptide repeat protein [Pseudolabrys sp.]
MAGDNAATPVMPLADTLMLADRYRGEGRLMEAEALCRQVLTARPKTPEAEHLLGVILHQTGKAAEAIEHIRRAIKVAPQNALFHANLGEMLRLAGRPKLSAESARRAIEIDPTLAAAWGNLGVALFEMKDHEGSARAHRRAIEAKPDFAQAHSNLGNALYAQKKYDEAIASYRGALAIDPNFSDAWANLGTVFHHSGEFEDGIFALRRAVALAPDHANAHSGLGILLLMRGDLAEGWEEYEWRLRSSERKGPRFPEKPWQGESLAGKHIYVQAEQGFGDTLQFARYIPYLAARAARVSFRTHQQLTGLLRESLPGVNVLGDRGDLPPYDCDAVLLSLPRILKTRLETIPAQVPYLRAPADIAARWRRRLASLPGLKVGLVWAGNPEHVNDMRRSLDLAMLTPLLETPGTSFVSLQVGPRGADLKSVKELHGRIHDVGPELVDFTDTAGAMSALDLIISVDTSPAHVAGALGKAVWVPLPWVTDWRWLLEREDNPWYPTMRLFRQRRGEEWDNVIAKLAGSLAALASGDQTQLTPFKQKGEHRAALAAEIIAAEASRAVMPPPEHAMTSGQMLILAEQKRRHGFLADADELCRRALFAEPNNAEALHQLGIIAQQSGRLGEAIEYLRRAIALNPDVPLYHANLGEMCRLAGRIEEAKAAGEHALKLNPDYAEAHSNLGIVLFELELFAEALSHYERAIALRPTFVQAHSNRGNALQRLKRFDEAEPCYRRAIEIEPQFVDAWNNLGTTLRELKRPEEAEAVYRKALEMRPNDPEILDNLALCVKDLDRLDEAETLLRRALAIEARSDKIHIHFGTVLVDQNKAVEAQAAAERALALNPKSHDAINLMGRVAFDRGDLPAALDYYQRAIVLKPDLADAYNNMGNALKELGRLREAHDAYCKSIEIDPNISGVYVNLADSKKFKHGDAHLSIMERMAATAGSSRIDRMHLDFALGKAYADMKDYDRSFGHLLAGNAAKRATTAYDEEQAFALFDRVEQVFSPTLITEKTGGGEVSARPIFIIGMPRSGTTLIEQLLASHPAVHGAGELKIFNDVVLTVRGPDGKTLPYPEFVPALDARSLREIGAEYVKRLAAIAPDGERVTDKMPSNYYFAGLIHLALPNATIVHAMRDPVDTCVSCFSKLFAAEQNHTYDLAELGRYYTRYHGLIEHWRRVLPPGRILDVRYEDVVADLEGQARRILSHCGLPWDDRCLAFHKTDRPIRTASATQVRQPIYKTAIGRWRAYDKFLGPLRAELD